MTQAEGDGNSFLIRPVAMKPGDYEIVADRLYQVLSTAPTAGQAKPLASPSDNIAGVWDVDIEYEIGGARHKLFLALNGNQITGMHRGWAYEGELKGSTATRSSFVAACPPTATCWRIRSRALYRVRKCGANCSLANTAGHDGSRRSTPPLKQSERGLWA
jgi:hypothetical protein